MAYRKGFGKNAGPSSPSSWDASSGWGGDYGGTWDGAGKGQKSKRNWSAPPKGKSGWEEEQAWQNDEGGEERTWRIKAPYHASKQLLRYAAGPGGSVFVKLSRKGGVAPTDTDQVSKAHLKSQLLTNESSHLLRRPGIGVSEHAATVTAGIDILQNKTDFTDFAEDVVKCMNLKTHDK